MWSFHICISCVRCVWNSGINFDEILMKKLFISNIHGLKTLCMMCNIFVLFVFLGKINCISWVFLKWFWVRNFYGFRYNLLKVKFCHGKRKTAKFIVHIEKAKRKKNQQKEKEKRNFLIIYLYFNFLFFHFLKKERFIEEEMWMKAVLNRFSFQFNAYN